MGEPRRRNMLTRAMSAALLAPAIVFAGGAPADAAVTNPAADPFYAQPPSFAGTVNGQVLRSRQVTVTGLGIPLPFTSYQVQYVTEDTLGKPQANVATVLKPFFASSSPKLVSYQPAIDSLSYNCDPSYKLRIGTEAEAGHVAALLMKGWTVVVPDYLGPDHQWTAAYVEGKGTLDGIRAAENLPAAGLRGAATPVGLTGYSGGARGTEFAAELAPTYAPELDIVGAAPGGLAVDVGEVGKAADGGLFSGVYFAAAMGLGRAYPELGIDALLNDKGKQLQNDISTMCIEQYVASYAFQRIESYTVGGVDPLTLPSIQAMIGDIRAGNLGTPKAPLYLYMAKQDELVVPGEATELVEQYCSSGVTIQYAQHVGGHLSEEEAGFPGALSWLSDRFAGKPAPSSC